MTIASVLEAAQHLDGEMFVELYELDTTPLFTVNGVATPGGQVYRWCSGIIDIRTDGILPPAVTQTDTVITLDRLLPLVSGRAYQISVDLLDGNTPSPMMVSSFTTASIPNPYGAGSVTISVLTLAVPLAAVPVAGAAWTLIGTNAVRFRGNDYVPMPIEVVGYEWAGTGKLPRPKLKISNIGNFAAALVIAYGDLARATLTRIRTFRRFLDDGDDADPTAFFEPDIFVIDRKSAHHKDFIEFELAAALDQQGLRLPRRIMLRDTCGYVYRQWATSALTMTTGFVQGTCPYAGSAYFTADDVATIDPASDKCGLRQSSCLARFGTTAPLPFNAFPGISISR